jgi:hypothetical protein
MFFPAIRQAIKENFGPAVCSFVEKASGLPIITRIGVWTPLTIAGWIVTNPSESIMSATQENFILDSFDHGSPNLAIDFIEMQRQQSNNLSPTAGPFLIESR